MGAGLHRPQTASPWSQVHPNHDDSDQPNSGQRQDNATSRPSASSAPVRTKHSDKTMGTLSLGIASINPRNLVTNIATDMKNTLNGSRRKSCDTNESQAIDQVLRRGLASMCYDDVAAIRKNLDAQRTASEAAGKWVILPGGRNLTYWRSFMIIIVLAAVAMAPFELAFDWWIPTFSWKFIGRVVDCLCILDMGINFFIGHVHHGRLVANHWKIAKHYFKTWFLMDLLSNFPWDMALSDRAGKSRKIVKLLKLPKVIRITRLLRVVREEAHYVGPFFTVAFLMIVAHYCSCVWASLLIDCNSIWDDNTMDGRLETPCPEVGRAYTEGFSVGMSALTGSDSWTRFLHMGGRLENGQALSPFTWTENSGPAVELAAAGMCVVGLCVIAVLFGNIAKAIERKDSHSADFNTRLQTLKAAVHQYAIPHDLYVRVRKHYHYMWNCGVDTAKEILMDKALSVGLRRQLAFSFYGNWLRKVSFFSNSQEALLQRMAECVDTECFSPEDPIIVAGETGTELYFLVVGRVMIITRQGKLLRVMDEGSFFGEMGLLFPETCRTVNVVAHTFGWLLVVTREALEDICSDELLDVFRSVAQERFAYNPGTAAAEPSESGVSAEDACTTATTIGTPLEQAATLSLDDPRDDHCVSVGATIQTPAAADLNGKPKSEKTKNVEFGEERSVHTNSSLASDQSLQATQAENGRSVKCDADFESKLSSPTRAKICEDSVTKTLAEENDADKGYQRSCTTPAPPHCCSDNSIIGVPGSSELGSPVSTGSLKQRVHLKVTVVSAENLRNADNPLINGLSDPYCICRVQGKPDTEWKTHTVLDCLNPVWNCEQMIQNCLPGDTMEFIVMDKDSGKADDFLGRVALPSALFLPNGFEGKVPLQDEVSKLGHQKSCGQLQVKVSVIEVISPNSKKVEISTDIVSVADKRFSTSLDSIPDVPESLSPSDSSRPNSARTSPNQKMKRMTTIGTQGLPSTYKTPARTADRPHVFSRSRTSRPRIGSSNAKAFTEESLSKFEDLATRLESTMQAWGNKLGSRLDGMEDTLAEIVDNQKHLDEKLEEVLRSGSKTSVHVVEAGDRSRSESPHPLN